MGVNMGDGMPGLTPPDAGLIQQMSESEASPQTEQTQKGKRSETVFSDRLETGQGKSAASQASSGSIQLSANNAQANQPNPPIQGYAQQQGESPPEQQTRAAYQHNPATVDNVASKTGKWLVVSAKSVIAECMLALAKTTRNARVVQVKMNFNFANLFADLAKAGAKLKRQIAKKQAAIYQQQAMMGIVQAATGAASMGMGVYAARCSMRNPDAEGKAAREKSAKDGESAEKQDAAYNAASAKAKNANGFGDAWNMSIGRSISDTATGASQAMAYTNMARIEREKGELEAAKEIVDAVKNIIQQSMQSGAEHDKKLEDLLKSTLQRAQQIYTQESRAHSHFTQHNQA